MKKINQFGLGFNDEVTADMVGANDGFTLTEGVYFPGVLRGFT